MTALIILCIIAFLLSNSSSHRGGGVIVKEVNTKKPKIGAAPQPIPQK